VHALQGFGAINLLEKLELEKQRLEVGAGEAVFDAADAGS
jgi:hypothetical protein